MLAGNPFASTGFIEKEKIYRSFSHRNLPEKQKSYMSNKY
jgi:hypothetical protein